MSELNGSHVTVDESTKALGLAAAAKESNLYRFLTNIHMVPRDISTCRQRKLQHLAQLLDQFGAHVVWFLAPRRSRRRDFRKFGDAQLFSWCYKVKISSVSTSERSAITGNDELKWMQRYLNREIQTRDRISLCSVMNLARRERSGAARKCGASEKSRCSAVFWAGSRTHGAKHQPLRKFCVKIFKRTFSAVYICSDSECVRRAAGPPEALVEENFVRLGRVGLSLLPLICCELITL